MQSIRQRQEAERARVKKAIAEMKRKMDGWVPAPPLLYTLCCALMYLCLALLLSQLVQVCRRQLQPHSWLSGARAWCSICSFPAHRLQREKQAAEVAAAESRGKAAAELEALRQEAAAAEQRLQAAKVRRERAGCPRVALLRSMHCCGSSWRSLYSRPTLASRPFLYPFPLLFSFSPAGRLPAAGG